MKYYNYQTVQLGTTVFICGGQQSPHKTSHGSLQQETGEVVAQFHHGCYLIDVAIRDPVPSARAVMKDLSGKIDHALANTSPYFVFSIGGIDEKSVMTKVCCKHDLLANTWTEVQPLQEARKNVTLCVFAQRRLYAIGGVLRNNEPATTIHYLDTTQNLYPWVAVKLRPDPAPRLPLNCGAIQTKYDCLMIFGGGSPEGPIATVYHFNPLTCELKPATCSLASPGTFRGAQPFVAGADMNIYVFSEDRKVHKFLRKTNIWESIPEATWKGSAHDGR